MRLCACGCRQPTKPYPCTDRRYGWVKGEPAQYVRGHYVTTRGPRGPYRVKPRPDAPKCDRSTLAGPRCRALDCRVLMHRNRDADGNAKRKCREGHRRHAGRGICDACRKRPHPPQLGPIEQPRMRPDEVLDEWVWLGGPDGAIRFDVFAGRIGVRLKTLQTLFKRAEGDPRAVRHPSDQPVRHWRAS